MEEEPRAPGATQRFITWRSVGLGLLLAVVIALITPYNDYVVNNSFLVGSYFPPIVTLAVFAVVLLVNGPLHRWLPRLALSPGELALAMAMGLIACSVPSQGLFRQFVPMPVAPFHFTDKADYHDLFRAMHLPNWLWPLDDAEAGSRDRLVTAFYSRLTPEESIPWSHWVRPVLGWGLFATAFLTTLIALACLLRFQWTTNERLAFPIAQLQSMLVAPPRPGRAFNDLFANRGFWIAVAFVVVVQSSGVLNLYFPKNVPALPFGYDFKPTFRDQPWTDLPDWLKASTVYFTLVGVSYFTTTRVSFSLWGSVLALAVVRWLVDPGKAYLPDGAYWDQGLGASFAFVAGVIWIGRAHWATIARALVGRARPGDARGAFVSYRVAAVALLLGLAGMFAWLVVVGCAAWLAAGVVLMIVMAHVITARVVAETGLAFLRVNVPFDTILKALPASLLTPRDAFLYGAGHYGYMFAARESGLVFTMHGLNVIDDTLEPGAPRRATLPVLVGTLGVTLIACLIASLWCYYRYATPMLDDGSGLLNKFGLNEWPQAYFVDFPTSVARGFYGAKAYSVWTQIVVGIGVMVFLQAMTWRFAAWPLLPVGYLLCSSGYLQIAWLSLFIGWLAKSLILRFGGAKLFNDLKPVFVGFIFGEALAVGLWLIVTLCLALSGEPFRVVRFLPQ